MRVIKGRENDTGHHVAGCHDHTQRWYHALRRFNEVKSGDETTLMPVLSARGRQMSSRAMEKFKRGRMAGLREYGESGGETLLCASRKVNAESRGETEDCEIAPHRWKVNWSYMLNVLLLILAVREVNLHGHWVREVNLLCHWARGANSGNWGGFWKWALEACSWSWPSSLVLDANYYLVLGANSWSSGALRYWTPEVRDREWWWNSLLLLGVALILVNVHSIDFERHLRMPRDRPRMGSRRGGIQGRAPPREDHHSPSSSIEVTSQPCWFQDSNDEVGGQKESSPIEGDSQRELPMLRYRLPCPHVNSSLIVTIAVEPGIEPQLHRQHPSGDDSPVACLPVGEESGWAQPELVPGMGWSVPCHAGGRKLERPGLNLDPEAGPSVRAVTHPPGSSKGKQKMEDSDPNLDPVASPLVRVANPLPGPRELSRKDSPHKIIQLSDSENTLHFGCRIAEELQSTDEE